MDNINSPPAYCLESDRTQARVFVEEVRRLISRATLLDGTIVEPTSAEGAAIFARVREQARAGKMGFGSSCGDYGSLVDLSVG